ncbi:hypothetical protein ACFLUM_01210 [Chloroflexota bacterium]
MSYNLTSNQQDLLRWIVEQVRNENLTEEFLVTWTAAGPKVGDLLGGSVPPVTQGVLDALAAAGMLVITQFRSPHSDEITDYRCTLTGTAYDAVDSRFAAPDTSIRRQGESTMKDSELRRVILQKYYEKRKDDWVSVNSQDIDDRIPVSEILRISQQLDEQGLVEFKPLRGDDQVYAGFGRITARGIDAVEQGGLGISSEETDLDRRLQRLVGLQGELAHMPDTQHPADHWAPIQAWITKATPVMRHDWPEFFHDFQQVTSEPTRLGIAGAASRSVRRSTWETNKAATDKAVKGILAFLYGLLTVGDTSHPDAPPPSAEKSFVNPTRLDELRGIEVSSFDLTKLIRLCEELNSCYANECHFATAMLTRAILDHVPPIFGFKSFREVANNYRGGSSFRDCMQHLDNFSRKIADSFLHMHIRGKETLPNATQVDSSSELDALLSEVVRILK